MTAVELVVVGAASWAVLASVAVVLPGCASMIGKFRARRRREFTNLITVLPPVPAPAPKPDDDADWFAAWACDTPLSVIEAAYWHKEFLAIPEVAAELRNVR